MKRRMIWLALSIISGKVCFSQNDCGVCEQLKKNVVKITTSFSDGSDENGFGTVIAEKGGKLYIVTAKHIIYKLENSNNVSTEIYTKSVNLKFYNEQGKNYPAQLLSLSNNIYDITVLEVVKPENYEWSKDFYSNTIERNNQVWFIGRAGKWYVPTGPKIGTINDVSIDDEIIIDINSIQPGTSGAPLISKDGMVGVIFEDALTGAQAYTIDKVKKIITNWNYEWQMNLYPRQQTPVRPQKEISVTQIGNQFWMTKNLDVDSYKNGDQIPNVTDPKAWAELTTGAYCYYDNDSAKYAAIYGKLYNWYAVNDPRGLAPTGWHIPTDTEYSILSNYLGGEKAAGGKMKEIGTTHWTSPNTGASNSSGFSGLPGGYRNYTGAYFYFGKGGYWWNSSESGTTFAWYRHIGYGSTIINKYDGTKLYGLSVRCLRD